MLRCRHALSALVGGVALLATACEKSVEPTPAPAAPGISEGSIVAKAICDPLTSVCSAWEGFAQGFPAHVAIHMHLLPTGEVLLWPGEEGPTHGTKGYQFAFIWNPTTGATRQVDNRRSDVFCSGHAFMPDGRLLVAGGHIADGKGRRETNIFDPFKRSWTRAADMNAGRWYPTATTLANGDVLVSAGTDENGNYNAVAQVFSASRGGGWRSLSGASRNLPYYPLMFLAPDGRVFDAGPQAQSAFLDPSGAGSWSDGPATVNRIYRDYGSAVMYAPGKILLVGGGGSDGSSDPGPTRTAETIDLTAGGSWQSTGNMSIGRRMANATVLPDGKVLITGGTSGYGFNNEGTPVKTAELWDPSTGAFSVLPAQQRTRMYHSTTLLLPDGRILSAGGGRCGSCTINNLDAEIFDPPYLFDGAGNPATRPVITSAPTQIGYGASFTIGTGNPSAITRISLIRLPSVTHAFDQNQRFVPITSFSAQGGNLSATAPTDRNIAPPGHYMLFILNAQGVPSVAKIVQLG